MKGLLIILLLTLALPAIAPAAHGANTEPIVVIPQSIQPSPLSVASQGAFWSIGCPNDKHDSQGGCLPDQIAGSGYRLPAIELRNDGGDVIFVTGYFIENQTWQTYFQNTFRAGQSDQATTLNFTLVPLRLGGTAMEYVEMAIWLKGIVLQPNSETGEFVQHYPDVPDGTYSSTVRFDFRSSSGAAVNSAVIPITLVVRSWALDNPSSAFDALMRFLRSLYQQNNTAHMQWWETPKLITDPLLGFFNLATSTNPVVMIVFAYGVIFLGFLAFYLIISLLTMLTNRGVFSRAVVLERHLVGWHRRPAPAYRPKSKKLPSLNLTERCVSCGHPLRNGAKFCPNCGKTVQPQGTAR